MTVLSLFFMVFMNLLELLVAYIQAYVFTMLSAVFIGLSRPEHEHKRSDQSELIRRLEAKSNPKANVENTLTT